MHATTLLMALHELRVKRVPIYTRLDSFKHILKIRPPKSQGYVESNKQETVARAHVLQVYIETFQCLNKIATKKKQAAFDAFKLKVLEIMH